MQRGFTPSKATRYFSRKWWGIAFVGLALAFIITGTLVTYTHKHAVRAAGGATITVPPQWNYSNSVDAPPLKVTGSNFATSETVNVYWNCSGSCSGSPNATATTKSGAFTASFLPPLAPSKTYPITAVGQTSHLSATALLLYLPQLYVFPRGTGAGSPITVHGNAFAANEIVKVYWNYNKNTNSGTLIGSPTTDSNGVFVTSNTNIPAGTAPGYYYVGAVGQTSQISMRFQVLVYTPSLALAPVSGSAGTSLTVSALGFAGPEGINIYWNNGNTPITTSTANAFGHLPPTAFTVPTGTAPGSYIVKAVGQNSKLSITNTFTVVAPNSNLSVTSGPAGVNVKAAGQGYLPHETVNVLWNYTGSGTGTNVTNMAAGNAGTVNAYFNIPAAAPGSYNIALVGATSKSVSQSSYTLVNGLAASPNSNAPGTQVTAVGSGFTAGESVKLYWDSTSGTLLATTNATNGNISQAIQLPATATPGSHSIIGVGQTSHKSFNGAVTVDTQWGDFGFNVAHSRENIYENSVNATNVSGLKLKWSVPIATPLQGEESSPVYANGTVFVPSSDGTLKAFNATTGTLLWASKTNTGFLSYASALVDSAAGLVYFGTCMDLPGPFYALDIKTGAVKWSVILAGSQYTFPTIAFHNVYVGISKDGGIPTPTHDTELLALDEMSGRVVWQHSTNGGVWGAVGVDTKTKTVFTGIGDPDNAVMALHALSGKQVWHTKIPNSIGNADVGSAITVANGMVYASSKNGSEYALNESDGTIVWNTALGTPTGNISSQAVSANGTLYVGSLNRVFFALDAKTGALKWKYGSPFFIFSSPAVANGVVYFADTDTNFYAVDANTGSVLWSFATGNKSYSSPIIVNGWLYCISSDGKLYAFGL